MDVLIRTEKCPPPQPQTLGVRTGRAGGPPATEVSQAEREGPRGSAAQSHLSTWEAEPLRRGDPCLWQLALQQAVCQAPYLTCLLTSGHHFLEDASFC